MVRKIEPKSKRDLIIEQIDKIIGGDQSPPDMFLPTGCLVLDLVTGGGYPLGRLTQIYGPDAAGKTLLGLTACYSAIKAGGLGIFLDTERKNSDTLRENIAQWLGVNVDELIKRQPDTLNTTLGAINTAIGLLADSGSPNCILWDSIAASCSREADEDKYNIFDLQKATSRLLEPRELSRWFKQRSFKNLYTTTIALIVINQIRTNVGVRFGDNENPPGGWSLRHNSALILRAEGYKTLPSSTERVDGTRTGVPPGIFIKIEVKKNQMSRPFQECIIPIFFDRGIDDALASLLYIQKNKGLNYSKGWFEYNGRKWRKSALWEEMQNNIDVYKDISDIVREIYKGENQLYKGDHCE